MRHVVKEGRYCAIHGSRHEAARARAGRLKKDAVRGGPAARRGRGRVDAAAAVLPPFVDPAPGVLDARALLATEGKRRASDRRHRDGEHGEHKTLDMPQHRYKQAGPRHARLPFAVGD